MRGFGGKTIKMIKKYFYGFDRYYLQVRAGRYKIENVVREFNLIYEQNYTVQKFKEITSKLKHEDLIIK